MCSEGCVTHLRTPLIENDLDIENLAKLLKTEGEERLHTLRAQKNINILYVYIWKYIIN